MGCGELSGGTGCEETVRKKRDTDGEREEERKEQGGWREERQV